MLFDSGFMTFRVKHSQNPSVIDIPRKQQLLIRSESSVALPVLINTQIVTYIGC